MAFNRCLFAFCWRLGLQRPKLAGTAENDPAGITLRAILGNVEGTITGELARRAAKSAES